MPVQKDMGNLTGMIMMLNESLPTFKSSTSQSYWRFVLKRSYLRYLVIMFGRYCNKNNGSKIEAIKHVGMICCCFGHGGSIVIMSEIAETMNYVSFWEKIKLLPED